MERLKWHPSEWISWAQMLESGTPEMKIRVLFLYCFWMPFLKNKQTNSSLISMFFNWNVFLCWVLVILKTEITQYMCYYTCVIAVLASYVSEIAIFLNHQYWFMFFFKFIFCKTPGLLLVSEVEIVQLIFISFVLFLRNCVCQPETHLGAVRSPTCIHTQNRYKGPVLTCSDSYL